jgi:hypothetical protein
MPLNIKSVNVVHHRLNFEKNKQGNPFTFPAIEGGAAYMPVGLYMNGELAQVQSGCLDLKSLILRSCNTCL